MIHRFPNPIATAAKVFRRNSYMGKPTPSEAEVQKLKFEMRFVALPKAKSNVGTNPSIERRDTMLSVIVLLLVCLGLAALAHVVV